jgi:transposase
MKSVYDNVCAVGLDVHYKFTTVSMRDEEARLVRRERLDHCDRARLRQVLGRWPKEVPMVMEASFGWGWLADLMVELGLNPQLCNCYKLEQMRKARGPAKTNRKDADLLSQLPFEKDQWWKVWMSPPQVRDLREQMRHRSSLVAVQTQTKNRISALFHRHGIIHDFSDLFGVAGRQFLAQVCQAGKAGEVVLPPGAAGALEGLLALLDFVRSQLADIARQLRCQLESDQVIARLDGIPGIGLILAHTLLAEIGQIERFKSHRALANYCLLAPIPDDTGEDDGSKPIGRHLGKRGNQTLKWAMLEAARLAVRKGGKWRRIFDAATQNGRNSRNRGYIKVARELVKVVYVVLKRGVEYSDTPPARPGSVPPQAQACDLAGLSPRQQVEKFLSSTRSGTGQSTRPMAAVR